MKKFLKFLKWAAVVTLGMPVLIYAVWVAGNLGNDELAPEVAKLLEQHPAQLGEKDNAYFDTIGLAAPPGMDPHAWGVAWLTQASANDRAHLENKPDSPIQLASYPPGKQIELPCSFKDARYSCLDEIARDTAAAQEHLDRESILLQRFDAQLDKDYQEPYREGSLWSEIAPRSHELRATRLAQIRFALEIAKGNDDAALGRWGRETSFILRQAENSHTLIDKLVLAAALNRYQRLLAEYLADHPRAARARATQLLAMLEPFDKPAVTLRPAFEAEAGFAARSLVAPKMALDAMSSATGDELFAARMIRTLATPLFDRQATANEMSTRMLEYARIAELEGDAYRSAIAKMAAQQNQPADESPMLHYHNPIGRLIIANVGAPDYSKYLYRSDDILANKKLMAFALDLISRDATSPKQVTDEINAKQADLKHPYTGELPNWNAEKRTLSYPIWGADKGPNYAPLVIRL